MRAGGKKDEQAVFNVRMTVTTLNIWRYLKGICRAVAETELFCLTLRENSQNSVLYYVLNYLLHQHHSLGFSCSAMKFADLLGSVCCHWEYSQEAYCVICQGYQRSLSILCSITFITPWTRSSTAMQGIGWSIERKQMWWFASHFLFPMAVPKFGF